MKKIIAMILCLVTVLSLTACGQNEDIAATTGQETTTQAATTAATTAETVTEATQPADTAPTETQPEETKPKETKPTQPAPTQPKPSVEPTTEGATEPTAPSIQTLTQKEQFKALAGVVGMNLFDAVEKLGWSDAEVIEEETCLYSLPLQVYLDGTKYQVFFGISEKSAKVSEVLYQAEFSTKALEVAREALKAVDTVDQWVGKENQLAADGSFVLRDVTELDVSAGISLDEFAYSMISWDYSKQAKKTQTEFIKECGEGVGFGVFLEVSRACLKDGDKVVSDTCTINFSVGAIPV